jgi:hypothetical protein
MKKLLTVLWQKINEKETTFYCWFNGPSSSINNNSSYGTNFVLTADGGV